MPLHRKFIRKIVAELMPSAKEFLCRLISFSSTSGKEHELFCWAEQAFQELGVEVRRVPLSEAIKQDQDYSSPIADIRYDGRFNLRLCLPGTGCGKKLLFNSHADVVPPSQGQERPWEAIEKAGILCGRGACDAKGQLATIYLVLAALKKLDLQLAGDVIAHVVSEEEIGGNGTLAMIRAGETADACIVLEPSSNQILSSARGVVWFRILCQGTPGHSGRPGDTVSALTLARKVMDLFEKYHDDLLARSRGIPLFDKYENPMPINFGRCVAGDWPATAPARAVVEGMLGFLPNKSRFQVMDEMLAVLEQSADARLRDRVSLEFTFHHDSHVLCPQHPLVERLRKCCGHWGLSTEIDALTATCDSWFYNNHLRIPTVIFGPGTLRYAHSDEEQIGLDEIAEAGCVLTDFAAQWCQ
jgi:acetylornithine deacetylase